MLTTVEVTARLRAARDALLADLADAVPDVAAAPNSPSHTPARRHLAPAAAAAAVAATIAGTLAVATHQAGSDVPQRDGGRATLTAASSPALPAAPGAWNEPNAAFLAAKARLTEAQLAAELHQMAVADEQRRIDSGAFNRTVHTFSTENVNALEENYIVNILRYCTHVPPALDTTLRGVLASFVGPQIAHDTGRVAPADVPGPHPVELGTQLTTAPGAQPWC